MSSRRLVALSVLAYLYVLGAVAFFVARTAGLDLGLAILLLVVLLVAPLPVLILHNHGGDR